MRSFIVSEELNEILVKLAKKNKPLHEQLTKKMQEVLECGDIDHYKNLRYNFKESKRVHVGHFVLIFQYDPTKDEILFDYFDHHDKVYQRK